MKKSNTRFVGKVLLQYAKLPSTNTFALEWLSKTKPCEGTVISTHDQWQGRGQIGSSWESAPGQNLAASVIWYPEFLAPKQQFLLSKAMALATRETIGRHLPDDKVYIKWPNDILVGEQKIGGLLLQNAIQGNTLQYCVAGIGLNVNQTHFQPYAPRATSLHTLKGTQTPIDELLDELCVALEVYYILLRNGQFRLIDQTYLEHLFLLNQSADFQRTATGETFSGYIRGVTEHGALLIEHADDLESFSVKEVRLQIHGEVPS